jgi:plasmid stability protein
MPTLVIKSFPEDLHDKLRQIAASHRRSVTQETIHLLELAIFAEENPKPAPEADRTLGQSRWASRKLLPDYEALLKSGALNSDTDSTVALSEERDAR